MTHWELILEQQSSSNPPRLTEEDAVLLYNEADFNALRQVAFE